MREIKFRVFNTAAKTMYPLDHFGLDMSGVELQLMPSCGHYEEPFLRNRSGQESMIYMQFIGLHDKNGREIYEGDIIELKQVPYYKKYVVFFADGGFYMNENGDIKRSSVPVLGYTLAVVGNIYENTDLVN